MRSFHAMAAARGIADRVERALERAAEVEHLGAVWELDAEGARERARQLEARAARDEDVGPLAGTVCAWKDCFDVAGLHTTGGAPWRASAPAVRASATIVERLEQAGAITLGKLAMTQLAWGMMGQTPGRPACRNPHDPRASRAAPRRARRSPLRRASPITHPAPTRAAACAIRQPPAASWVSSRPTDPCRWTAACPTRRAMTPAARSRAPSPRPRCSTLPSATRLPPISPAASRACAWRSWAATSAPRSTTTSRPCSSARGSTCAPVRLDLTWSREDNRSMSPIFVAEPGAFVLEHDPQPDPARYDAAHRRRRRRGALAAGHRLRARPARARAGPPPLRGSGGGLRHPACASAPCAPVPIDGPDRTRRMNALTKPFNALGWPALSLPAGLDRDGLPLGLQVVGLPGSDDVVLRAAAASRASSRHDSRRARRRRRAGARGTPPAVRRATPPRRAASPPGCARRPRPSSPTSETLMRMAVRPCQTVPPHQQVPSAWSAAITRCVAAGSPNETSTWLSTTSFSIS